MLNTEIKDITALYKKLDNLKSLLSKMEDVLVAISGGVDSSLLLWIAKGVCRNVVAATSEDTIFPPDEIEEAVRIADFMGVEHQTFSAGQIGNQEFLKNPPNRCYICKVLIFKKLKEIAKERGIRYILDGTNYSDLNKYRPGIRAAEELGIISPLVKTRLTKGEIRLLSEKFRLPNWNRPAQSCLATRIPYNQEITPKRLKRIDRVESFLKEMGVDVVRVRDHNKSARIETTQEYLKNLNERSKIVSVLKEFGYESVTFNIVLPEKYE
jgi:uncharacterized protein